MRRLLVHAASALLVVVPSACSPGGSDESPEQPPITSADGRRDIAGSEENLYSQHGEELVIRDFFQDKKNGIFLDVGAAWPVHFSNTYYLEKELGWTGVAVDALAEHGSRWRRRRPASQFFAYIVTDHSGGMETFYRTKKGELIGISSLTPGASLGRKAEFEEIQVQTTTLTDLLEEAGVDKVDLLSMDIEGHELPALAGFDIGRFRPELVCVEVHATARVPVTEYFESKGYRRLEQYDANDQANYYFTPAGND